MMRQIERALSVLLDNAEYDIKEALNAGADEEDVAKLREAMDLVRDFADGVWMVCEREPSADFDNVGLEVKDVGIDPAVDVEHGGLPITYFMVDGLEEK